ncbi:hypothetical protein NJO91_19455 [Streptomyces microflavus]|uniref:hypothetical protein n=1 Tax=Streptomyces microflavus TaxID=1919 RepID=UPI0029AF9AE2|nr:hypothetical protein [Streptomyces microflavus]MDX2405289.1 hypothetical protein [Streptomyces microflavus]
MSTARSAAAHPFVAHLRQVAALEHDRRTAAEEACTKAQQVLDEARLRIADAEQELAQAEQRRLIAAERSSAAAAMIASAEDFLNEPAATAADAEDTQAADPPPGSRPPASDSRTLKELVLAVFTGPEMLSPAEVAPLVRVHRSKTTNKAVRSTLTVLRREGALVLVERGYYRLPKQEERL